MALKRNDFIDGEAVTIGKVQQGVDQVEANQSCQFGIGAKRTPVFSGDL